jgi:hypothetical protein
MSPEVHLHDSDADDRSRKQEDQQQGQQIPDPPERQPEGERSDVQGVPVEEPLPVPVLGEEARVEQDGPDIPGSESEEDDEDDEE